ncbi:class I SAM-dependent methyltransferase [Mycobacterium sp. M26]|uniref:class I SAM-dependent methyltransferase n=1 Tax=Mycobacterium sp. M26 TaxID=1762962 RepID=UPI00073F3F69|nr:class I SAM-dependent methyltransferase [Mycobacterium sp. M26]
MKQEDIARRVPPKLRKLLGSVKYAVFGRPDFQSSATYWEDRYRGGGTSGAGSYNRLAVFKAGLINDFVAEHGIQTVIEFGSGDGAQLKLARYPHYVGVDVSRTVLDATRPKFANDPTIRFIHTSELGADDRAELALSLDVIYHLVEDKVFDDYMDQLFNAATRFVIVYSSNDERPSPSPHVRHREWLSWVANNRRDFRLLKRVPNAYPYSERDPDNTSFADFYIFARSDD